MFMVSTVNTSADKIYELDLKIASPEACLICKTTTEENVLLASADSKESDQTVHMSPPNKSLRITETLIRLCSCAD